MQAFPGLVSILGMEGLFFLSVVSSVAGAVFTFFWIPVTKDKSMYELEILFSSKQKCVIKDLNLFDPESILDTVYYGIPYKWMEDEFRNRKR